MRQLQSLEAYLVYTVYEAYTHNAHSGDRLNSHVCNITFVKALLHTTVDTWHGEAFWPKVVEAALRSDGDWHWL